MNLEVRDQVHAPRKARIAGGVGGRKKKMSENGEFGMSFNNPEFDIFQNYRITEGRSFSVIVRELLEIFRTCTFAVGEPGLTVLQVPAN